MADLNYTLSIQDQQALRSLQNIQAQVQKTTAGFREFGNAIAAIATGAFTASAFQMATALDNISKSTGIALTSVVGFGQAFEATGGTIMRSVDAISDLNKNIGEAARGSRELQNSFGIAGVSLKDLGTLSEQDILRKTINGLAAIPDSATRTSTAMKLLGESVKGVDLVTLNRELDGFVQRAGPGASGIAAAAQAQKNFAQASTELQVQLLAALQPISELAQNITKATGAISVFIKTAVDIAVVAASFYAITKAFALVRTGIALLTGAFRDLFTAFKGLSTTFGSFGTMIRAIAREGAITDRTYTALGKRFKYLKEEIPLLGGALAVLGTGATLAYRALQRLFGVESDSGAENQSAAETKRLQAMNDRAAAADQAGKRAVTVNQAEVKAIQDSVRAYRDSNAESLKRIGLQTDLLRANEETRFAVETTGEAEQSYLKAIEPLQRQIQAIRAQGKQASETDLALLPQLEAGVASITKEYQKQQPALQLLISERIKEMQVAKELEIINQQLTKQTEDRLTVESAVRDIILNGQQRINDTYAEAAQKGLPGIYGELRKIADEENRIAEAAKRRVAEQFGDDTTGLDRAMAEIEAATQVIIQRRQEAVYSVSEQQNGFVAGWQKAFAEYASAASNAATQAQTIFSTVTKSMEDAFVNFAKTGKLSVKDLFKTIVETILRSQVQQLIARTFGALGGSTGGSFLGSLFAGFFADGGRIAPGKVGVVGEAGPEMITGPATVTPMGGGSGLTQVTYNINAVDVDSFRRLVASDPEFMFAVTEQGRRRLPQNRR